MTTKHTCGGPIFGRRAPLGQCARCDELTNGAPVVRWADRPARDSALRIDQIRKHDCARSRCGPICTAFDW